MLTLTLVDEISAVIGMYRSGATPEQIEDNTRFDKKEVRYIVIKHLDMTGEQPNKHFVINYTNTES